MGRLILVRHGAAAWGKRDYDQLTELGVAQAAAVGEELVARGIRPSLVLHGSLKRQRDTASGLVAAAGWAGATDAVPVEVDPRWNEYDHDEVIRVHKPMYRSMTLMRLDLARTGAPHNAFDEMFGGALRRWVGAEGSYREPYAAFTGRAGEALAAAAGRAGPGETIVVVSSGGVISAIAAQLLGGGSTTWLAVSRLVRNTGLTQIAVGAGGIRLTSLNETAHLDRAPHLKSDR